MKCTVLLCLTLVSHGRADAPAAHLADHGRATPDKWHYPKQPLTNDEYITCKRLLDQWRQDAMQQIEATHSHKWWSAWYGPSIASMVSNGAANIIPNLVIGTLAGMGADAVTLGSWYYFCKSDYDAATNVEQLFKDLFNFLFNVKNAASVENTACDYLFFELLGRAPQFIYLGLQKARNAMAKQLIGMVDTKFAKLSNAFMARLRTYGAAGQEGAVDRMMARSLARPNSEFRASVEQASVEAAEQVTTKIEETLASRAAGRAGQASTSEFPIIGTIVGGFTGLTLMRMCAGDINDDFRESYRGAVQSMYDTVCNKILSPDAKTIKDITG